LQMYHVGYHKGHRPSSNREPPMESATSITVQQREGHKSGTLEAVQEERSRRARIVKTK